MTKSQIYSGVHIFFFIQCLVSCSTLLPKDKTLTVGAWDTYEEAQQNFDKGFGNSIP